MDILLSVPVIIKVLGALAFILVVNGLCRHLLAAVTAGAPLLAGWGGHSTAAMAGIVVDRLVSTDYLFLLLGVLRVVLLSSQMSVTGGLR